MPIVIANDKGTIRAFHNVCSHRGAKLVHEKCSKRKTLLCPYHRWGYALDGRLMGTPDFDDDETGKKVPEALREKFRTHHVKNFDKASMGLKPVRIDSALGLAFVNLDETAPPLNEWLGDLVPWLDDYMEATGLGKMHASHHITYDIKANWKLLIENFLEYYHLPAVHPALCDVSGVDEHQRFQGKGMYCGCRAPSYEGGTAIDPGRLPPFPGLRPGGIRPPSTSTSSRMSSSPSIPTPSSASASHRMPTRRTVRSSTRRSLRTTRASSKSRQRRSREAARRSSTRSSPSGTM